MTLLKNTILLSTVLLLTITCQPPVIQNFDPDLSHAILTANQSYTRAGFQDFTIMDSLQLIETESLGGLPYFSFLQYSGELIYTTHNGRLYFSSLNELDETRKTEFGVGIGAAPTIQGTTLFIPINRGKRGLVAYDMLQGETLWELPGEFSQSSPIIINNMVIHATTFGAVAAYDIHSAERKWKIEIDDRVLNNLAFAEKNIVVLTQNGILRSYNPENGSLNWSLKLKDAFYASPVLNSSHIFVAGYKGGISKIDLLKGSIVSSRKINTHIYQTPAMDNNSVYIASGDGQLLALDINTLQQQWSQQLDGPVTAAPLVSRNEVILGTASRKLYRINKNNGAIAQTVILEGRPRSQPAFYDNRLYVAYEPDYIAILGYRSQP